MVGRCAQEGGALRVLALLAKVLGHPCANAPEHIHAIVTDRGCDLCMWAMLHCLRGPYRDCSTALKGALRCMRAAHERNPLKLASRSAMALTQKETKGMRADKVASLVELSGS